MRFIRYSSFCKSNPTPPKEPQMNEVTLTDNEVKALEACLNYSDRASQLSDNYSVAGAAEIAVAIGSSRKAAGGVQSSLIQKGLAFIDEDDVDILWLTEAGVNAIFDRLEGSPVAVDGNENNEVKENKMATPKKKAPKAKKAAKKPVNFPPNDKVRRDSTFKAEQCQRTKLKLPMADQFGLERVDGVTRVVKAKEGRSHYCGVAVQVRLAEKVRGDSDETLGAAEFAKVSAAQAKKAAKAAADCRKNYPAINDIMPVKAERAKAAPKAKAPAKAKAAKPAAKKAAPKAAKPKAKKKAAPKKAAPAKAAEKQAADPF